MNPHTNLCFWIRRCRTVVCNLQPKLILINLQQVILEIQAYYQKAQIHTKSQKILETHQSRTAAFRLCDLSMVCKDIQS